MRSLFKNFLICNNLIHDAVKQLPNPIINLINSYEFDHKLVFDETKKFLIIELNSKKYPSCLFSKAIKVSGIIKNINLAKSATDILKILDELETINCTLTNSTSNISKLLNEYRSIFSSLKTMETSHPPKEKQIPTP